MIYFVRHALDDERYVGSWSDVSILESEKDKVKEVAHKIKNLQISGIITSDITRARETAEIIGKELSLKVVRDNSLREQNKGTLTGKRRDALSKEELDLLASKDINTVFPGGESLLDVYKRIRRYLNTIDTFPDKTLVVTHRGVINMIYYILNDIPPDMEKERFDVGHLSVHEYDIKKKLIRRIIW